MSIDEPYTAFLESPWLPWKPYYHATSLCLRFRYLLPNPHAACLKVYQESGNEKVLIWNLTGFHGLGWLQGSVSWAGAEGTKVGPTENFERCHTIV